MPDQPDESNGKSWKLPLTHIGAVGGITAAIVMLNPVKQFFFTREEGLANVSRIEKLEVASTKINERILDLPTRSEIVSTLDKNTDRIIASVSEKDGRTNIRIDNLEKNLNNRIDLLLRETLNKTNPKGGK